MERCNTILSKIRKLVPRHEFETLAKQHHSRRAFCKACRWSQFVSLTMAQLSDRNGLRDIVNNMSAQMHRLYPLGSAKLSQSNLSRLKEDKPYALDEAIFKKLLTRCQGVAPDHNFRFNHPLFSLYTSTIDLCFSAFPWTNFRSTKGAIKPHTGLNHAGYLPEFVVVTEGKKHEVTVGRTLSFPKENIVAVEKAYNGYTWYKQLTDKNIFLSPGLSIMQNTTLPSVDRC
tara:strand:+ start:1120 stop:1806 length:687 start_codon:yes stop_codon:yes gene_type:complete